MSRVRPTAALANLGRQRQNATSEHLTTCKLCGCGIYRSQPHRWHTRPIGLSHTACVERLETTP